MISDVEINGFILYLEFILNKLSVYMDVSGYRDELYDIVLLFNKNTDIDVNGNQELYNSLVGFQERIQYYILFLDLVDSTNYWNYFDNIDDLFERIVHSFYKLLNLFSDRVLNKLVIERYYDLLLKKIWLDCFNGDYDLLKRYNHFNKYASLKLSIYNFLNEDSINISLDKDIEDYKLIEIFNIVRNSLQLPLIEDKLVDGNVDLKFFSTKRSYQRILDFILERSYKFFSKDKLDSKKKLLKKR